MVERERVVIFYTVLFIDFYVFLSTIIFISYENIENYVNIYYHISSNTFCFEKWGGHGI